MTAKARGTRQRIDLLLVERELAETREQAQALVMAGQVTADGQRVSKPGQAVDSFVRLEVAAGLPYVSRGGVKLAAALDRFEIEVAGKVCLDIGTSTGGFVDCLLQRGAARVHAVDTGAGQIDWKLRTNPQVVLHERTNARYLREEDIGETAAILTCDVSFISVTLLVPALAPLVEAKGDWVVLVKPQFEVGRERVGKGGIVRDPEAQEWACRRVAGALAERNFDTRLMESPIRGTEGNREFLLHARRHVTLSDASSC